MRMIVDVERKVSKDGEEPEVWKRVLPPKDMIHGTVRKGSKLWKKLCDPNSEESRLAAREWWVDQDLVAMAVLGAGDKVNNEHAGSAGVRVPALALLRLEETSAMSDEVRARLFAPGVVRQRVSPVWVFYSFLHRKSSKPFSKEWGVVTWEEWLRWRETKRSRPPKRYTRERVLREVEVVTEGEARDLLEAGEKLEPLPMVSVMWGQRNLRVISPKLKALLKTVEELRDETSAALRLCVGFVDEDNPKGGEGE